MRLELLDVQHGQFPTDHLFERMRVECSEINDGPAYPNSSAANFVHATFHTRERSPNSLYRLCPVLGAKLLHDEHTNLKAFG